MRPMFPWERISFTRVPDTGKMSRAVVLKPGDYDAYIHAEEEVDDRDQGPRRRPLRPSSRISKHELSSPRLRRRGTAKTSIPIVAATVEPLTAPLTPAQRGRTPTACSAR